MEEDANQDSATDYEAILRELKTLEEKGDLYLPHLAQFVIDKLAEAGVRYDG